MKQKPLALLLTAALAIGTLSGCGGTYTDSGSKATPAPAGAQTPAATGTPSDPVLAAQQTFTFSSANDLMSLDSSLIQDEMSAIVLYATNEGLIRTYQNEIIPGIAETWEVSEDGITYTFHLRDAKWSDGQAVTAGDFEYAFLRLLNPATGSPQVEIFNSVSGAIAYYSGESTDPAAVGVKAVDDKTLTITLTAPDPFFLEHLAQGINFYPIRKDIVEKSGAQYGSGPESYLGCGPFTLTEWVQTSSIVMEKNPSYWDAANIKLDKVTELIVGDENTAVGMYELGDTDCVYSITAAQTVKYPNFGHRSGGTLQHLVFQSGEGSPLASQNLRLALSYGIDRQSVVTALAGPGTEVADSMVDPGIALDGTPVLDTYPASDNIPASGDMAKAKEYLSAALKDLGLSDPSQLPAINYVCLESASHKAYAEALQAQWKQNLGIDVNVSIMPVPQAIGSLISGDFDIFLNGMSTGTNPDELLKGYVSGGENNYAKWDNAEFTALIGDYKAAMDIDEKMTLLQKAHQLMLDEAPVSPLWLPGTPYLVQEYVQDLYYGRETGSIEFIYASILEH